MEAQEENEFERLISQIISDAISKTTKDYDIGDIGGEDDFSCQMIGRIKSDIEHAANEMNLDVKAISITENEDGDPKPQVRVRAWHLTDKGPGSEEKIFGADIVLVIDLETELRKITKGVLIQSKILNSKGEAKTKKERIRLKDQCGNMLDYSAASFVFGITPAEVKVYSAAAIESCSAENISKVTTWGMEIFCYDFVICWVGDVRINATDRDSLIALRTLLRSKNALLIAGKE